MSDMQSVKIFLNCFSKKEILEALTETYCFERITNKMCEALFDKKSNELLDAMEKNAQKKCSNVEEMYKARMEFDKLNRELGKLERKFQRCTNLKEQ